MDEQTKAEIAKIAAMAAPDNVVRPTGFNQPPASPARSFFNRPNRRSVFGSTDQPLPAQGREQPSFNRQTGPQPQLTERLFHADQLLAKPVPPRRWRVPKWIPQAETTLLAGDGGAGKTTLAMQLAVACVARVEWLGIRVEPCPVLYVSAEDPSEELHFRLDQIRAQMQVQPGALAGLHILDLAGTQATIAIFDKNSKLKLEGLFGEIERIVRERKVGLVVLDAAADFFGGNENERNEVRAFIGALRGLAMRCDTAVIIVAHPSIDGMRTNKGYSGSTAWNNSVRSRLTFTKPLKMEGQSEPDPDLRVLELAKSNRARAGEQIQMLWFNGAFVRVAPGTMSKTADDLHVEQVFLELLDKLAAQGRRVSNTTGKTYAPACFAKVPGVGVTKAQFEGALERLFNKGIIYRATYGPPSHERHYLAKRGPLARSAPSNDRGSTKPSPDQPGQPAPRGAGP